MSQALTLARPYARAAFALARDEQAFAGWSQALGFSARIAGDPRVAGLLGDPKLSDGDAVTLLAPEPQGASFGRFLQLLADNRRLALLPGPPPSAPPGTLGPLDRFKQECGLP